jgi:hypothetical protein
MKLLVAAVLLAASGLGNTQGLNQTGPFNLQLHRCDNSSLNGQYLSPCHEGAAIEGLCPVTSPLGRDAFYFNYTVNTGNSNPTGYLTWMLNAAGGVSVSEPMRLSYDPTTNVAVPLFFPDQNGQLVGFDKDDDLYIEGRDDRENPLNMTKIVQYRRWSICTTYVGYKYDTLSWTMGEGGPENPTCRKVKVKRVFL